MYYCNNCGKLFKEPKVETEVLGTSDKTDFVNYKYCPYCDSGDFEKNHHYYCMECEYEWDTTEEYSIFSYCPKCHCGDLKEYEDEE